MTFDDPVLGPLTFDALTAGVSVYQRAKGHRFSSDDLVTAWVAKQVCPSPRRVLDLGCGLGSVLLHLAWSTPGATLVGIEAQDMSFVLAERNVAANEFGDRVRVVHGDLRDPAIVSLAAPDGDRFDLITGTPPYFPASAATDAMDQQRAFARIEYRGGIEAYAAAAAPLLTDDGWFVVCGDADADGRANDAAADTGLRLTARYTAVPRAGRRPLFSVWVMQSGSGGDDAVVEHVLTLRDADGERTDDAKALRAFSGFPDAAPPTAPDAEVGDQRVHSA